MEPWGSQSNHHYLKGCKLGRFDTLRNTLFLDLDAYPAMILERKVSLGKAHMINDEVFFSRSIG